MPLRGRMRPPDQSTTSSARLRYSQAAVMGRALSAPSYVFPTTQGRNKPVKSRLRCRSPPVQHHADISAGRDRRHLPLDDYLLKVLSQYNAADLFGFVSKERGRSVSDSWNATAC